MYTDLKNYFCFYQAHPAIIETIDPKSLIKSQEIIQGGDAGGVYVPKKVGNEDPNLHYGIVIDCGSSGSRLYIYIWPEHSGKENELLQIKQLLDKQGNPVVKKLEPGWTSFFAEIHSMIRSFPIRPFINGKNTTKCN